MDATEPRDRAARPAADGLVLGRYRLLRRIGSGGFGTVYEARDERLDRHVAVKAILPHGPAPERGPREALAAARLHHPAIVAVYDAGEDPAGRYLVSELVRGRTLAALEDAGALSDRDVLRAGLALASGLAHAHERGVIHRDVKPQNVIVPDEPSDARAAAKLTDFGVAHLAGDEPLTRTGDVVGTLAYMAPEQAAGERVDERADLYALALVLYEALAGTNPVRGSSPAATARLVGTVLPSLRRNRRDLPAELCAALDRALLPDPAERGTLDDLADELGAALTAVSDEGGTIAPHPLERSRRPARVVPRVAAGAAAGGLVAAVPQEIVGVEGAVAAAVLVALFPRTAWLLSAAACVGVLAGPEPELAALVAAGAAAPPLLLQRSGLAWSLPAAAPVLGLAGLSGAYPALGVGGAWTRAALGAIGAWWLLLAGPGARLEEVVTSEVLLLIPVWAVAALVLPWLVRGRNLAVDVVMATTWAAALGAAAERMGYEGLIVGAVVAGALALARGTVRGPV